MSRTGRAGFTLIELLVVLAVLALLMTVVSPRYFHSVDRAKEATLRTNLQETRAAIDRFFADKGRYPASLQELADERYLRAVPVDSITQRADTWTLVAPRSGAAGAIQDLRSGASGNASDGRPYASW
jgi:type II secretion system protein G